MSPRLLLVEDEIDAREALARALARAGYSVTAVGSAAAALEAARSGLPVDLAVVDVRLGTDERGGVELLRPLREATSRAPVVVITAFADLDTVKQALNEGAAYLLEKPFRAGDLVEVLRRLLGERDELAHMVARALDHVGLTDKEATIARLLLKGLPTAEIARLESNSDKTIRQHVSQIYAKCGVSSRAELFHHVFPT